MAYRVRGYVSRVKDRTILQSQQRTVRIPFASAKHAAIAKQAIEVDAELQPHAVERILMVEDDTLIA